jgi:thiol-disulfide isomerase/thioredoxin
MKYFILGFISCILIIVAVFFYFKFDQEDSVKEALSEIVSNRIEVEVYSINQDALDSLSFFNLYTSKDFNITEDSLRYSFINYWATWCVPCVVELPVFEKLIQNTDQDVCFIFASSEEEKDILKFTNKKEIKLPFYRYSKFRAPSFINHSTIPTSYLIDEKELLIYKFSGIQKWDSEFIKQLLKQLK